MINKEHEKQVNELMVSAIIKALKRANIPVVKASNDLAEMLSYAGQQIVYSKKKTSVTALPEDNSSFKGTAITDVNRTKILNNIDNLFKEYQLNPLKNTKTFLGDIANALDCKKEGGSNSRYKEIITTSGKSVTLRISDHGAFVDNFDIRNEEEGISIVVARKRDENLKEEGKAHVVEFFYSDKKLNKSEDFPLPEIMKSLRQTLFNGEYKDNTYIAEKKEVNARFLKDKSGTIYGWTSNGKIYLTKDGLNPKTMIHEYTHLWSNAMQIANPEGWQSVKDIMRQDPLWRDVKDDFNYADIADDEDMVVSEVLSRRSEQNNSVLLERQAQKVLREDSLDLDYQANQLLFKMKEALNTFWDWVTTKLFNMKRFQSMEQISNRVLYDLVNSTELGRTESKHNQPQYSILKKMENNIGNSLRNQIIDLDDPSILEKNPFDKNIVTSPKIIKHGMGYGVRCKVNGIWQSAETLTATEVQKYNRLLQSGNIDELNRYVVHLAESHFGDKAEKQQQNRSFKR